MCIAIAAVFARKKKKKDLPPSFFKDTVSLASLLGDGHLLIIIAYWISLLTGYRRTSHTSGTVF